MRMSSKRSLGKAARAVKEARSGSSDRSAGREVWAAAGPSVRFSDAMPTAARSSAWSEPVSFMRAAASLGSRTGWRVCGCSAVICANSVNSKRPDFTGV